MVIKNDANWGISYFHPLVSRPMYFTGSSRVEWAQFNQPATKWPGGLLKE